MSVAVGQSQSRAAKTAANDDLKTLPLAKVEGLHGPRHAT
jgi:hypothetical protein